MKRFGQALTAMAVAILGALARALPYGAALGLGRSLGRAAMALGLRRGVVLDNLARSYPEWSAAQVRDTARRTYAVWGQVFVDLLRAPALARGGGVMEVFDSIEGFEIVREAHAAGRGVILLSGHFGAFEFFGAAAAASGYPVDLVVQTQSNPWVDQWWEAARRGLGVGLIRRGSEVREALRALRANRCIAMAADQDARSRGVFVEFFGRPASTPIGPAALSLRTGAPIVMGFLVRGADGRHRGFFEPALHFDPTGDPDRDVEALTRQHVGVLEKWVRRHPEHWYWFHRRWKTVPPALLLALSLAVAPLARAPHAAPGGARLMAQADSSRSADDPTVFGGAGTSLLPLSETRVARVLEDVSLTRAGDVWTVEVADVFLGGGAPEVVRVGIPDFEAAPDSGGTRATLEDVRLVVDGVALAPSLEPGPERPQLPGLGGIGRFYVWEIRFGAEEWKLARLRYRLRASRAQGGEELFFYYWNPGTPWRGPSGRVNARVDLGGERVEDLVPGWLRPARYAVQGSSVVWSLATEEPEEDLVLALRAFGDPRQTFPDRREGPLALSPIERDEWLGRGTPREWRFWLDFVRVRRGEAAQDSTFGAILGKPAAKKPRRATKTELELVQVIERRLAEWDAHHAAASDSTRSP